MPASMREVMDAMMAGNIMSPFNTPFMGLLIVVPSAFIAVLAAGIIGFVYLSLFPEIKNVGAHAPPATETNATSLDAIIKTLSQDEQKVMKVLLMYNGKYLQKYIV